MYRLLHRIIQSQVEKFNTAVMIIFLGTRNLWGLKGQLAVIKMIFVNKESIIYKLRPHKINADDARSCLYNVLDQVVVHYTYPCLFFILFLLLMQSMNFDNGQHYWRHQISNPPAHSKLDNYCSFNFHTNPEYSLICMAQEISVQHGDTLCIHAINGPTAFHIGIINIRKVSSNCKGSVNVCRLTLLLYK